MPVTDTQGNPKQHIKFLRDFPPPPDVDAALRQFRNAVATCLLYGAEPPPMEMADEYTTMAWLNDLLARDFNTHIFVPRPVIHDIASLVRIPRLLIVMGHIGCGKSTALRKIRDDFPSVENVSLHYIDLSRYFDEIEPSGIHGYLTVAGILYEVLRKAHIVPAETALRLSWTVHRIRNHPHYRRLVERAEEDGEISDDQWLTLIESPPFKTIRDREFEPNIPPAELTDLKLLLEFLTKRLGRHLILILDNIDRYSLKVQAEVIHNSIDFANVLSPLLTPVVAVRSANFGRLVSEGEWDYIFLVRRIRTYSEIRPVDTDAATLHAFLSRRIEYLLSLSPDQLFGGMPLAGLATVLGFKSAADMVGRHMDVMRHLMKDLVHLDIARILAQWHNESLRNTAMQMFNILNSFLMSSDPLFTYRDAVRATTARSTDFESDRKLQTRRVRTAVYRHLVFGTRRPPAEPHTINMFTTANSLSETRPLYFLHLKVLQHLLMAKRSSVPYGHLLSDFARLGVSRDTLFRALEKLRRSRGYDNTGYLYIDRGDEHIGADMDPRSLVEILPSGRYLVEHLAISCEYLFWMALYTPVGGRLFEGSLDVAAIQSDGVRARVAAAFVHDYLLPRFVEEYRWYAAEVQPLESSDGPRIFAELFERGRDQGKLFPAQAANGIEAFMVRGQIAAQDKQETDTLLRVIRTTIEAVTAGGRNP